MTSSEIKRFSFSADQADSLRLEDTRLSNWPVVYTLNDQKRVYVGETINAAARMRQHRESTSKDGLTCIRIILDDRFNKSACLDLESHLIRLLSGDGAFDVINRNDGITDADYYDRESYTRQFRDIFEQLRHEGLLTRPVHEIENDDLYKYSPFKALNDDQALAVLHIVSGLVEAMVEGTGSVSVVSGEPGTGKTIVAVFLIKLLRDIATKTDFETEQDSVFADLFVPDTRNILTGLRIGFVVPQQSLRKTIQRVFKRTPQLDPGMVLSPFDVGKDPGYFDLLIVDETHRLSQRANQSSGPANKDFREITESLFGEDDVNRTQLDWVKAKSRHSIFLLDAAQSVRPADLPQRILSDLEIEANAKQRKFRLATQMRVKAGENYTGYINSLLKARAHGAQNFQEYDLRLYEDLAAMISAIRGMDSEHGLSRLLAGYAWPWNSKKDKAAFDITIGDIKLRWNSQIVDWVNSPKSVTEVGSIHTIQGYDLNYAGVIIGNDLKYDPATRSMKFDRSNYYDKKGMENNKTLGITYNDDDLLDLVQNIYRVLLTRGIRGTFVYAEDANMRDYLARYLPVFKG